MANLSVHTNHEYYYRIGIGTYLWTYFEKTKTSVLTNTFKLLKSAKNHPFSLLIKKFNRVKCQNCTFEKNFRSFQ